MPNDTIKDYANGMNASSEVLMWVDTALKAYLKKHQVGQEVVEHIIDYLCSDQAPSRLRKMSFKQAKVKSEEWTASLQRKGADIQESDDDIETVIGFDDGSRIVKLVGENAYKREGFLMRHCSASYIDSDSTLYSYRDSKNQPHATFEVQGEGNMAQVKGKGNGPIHPKYINPIIKFLEYLGHEVRESEMRNLGYYIAPDEYRAKLKELYPNAKTAVVNGQEYYVA